MATNVYELGINRSLRALSDEEIVQEILDGDIEQLGVLMRRHNQRLYRVCRSIVSNDGEAEEAVQEAYLRAYLHLSRFRGESKFSTWLTRIAVYEALARRKRRSRFVELDADQPAKSLLRFKIVSRGQDPEGEAINRDLARTLEKAIDALPPNYRTVFVLRHIEEFSTDQTAACLNLSSEAVKTRLHRSRRMLQESLQPHVLEQPVAGVWSFLGARCERLVEGVLARLAPQVS